MHDDERQARAARRREWPGRLVRLGQEPPEAALPPDEALAAMPALAERAWKLTGNPLPSYDRAHMPGRIVRGRS